MEELGEVEVLMERMKQLQECRDEEEASQEEMATRFEREKTESMLVATAGTCRRLSTGRVNVLIRIFTLLRGY